MAERLLKSGLVSFGFLWAEPGRQKPERDFLYAFLYATGTSSMLSLPFMQRHAWRKPLCLSGHCFLPDLLEKANRSAGCHIQ
jgi:hypothetical protein